ncbi:MAG TPA: Fe-S protein assembly co-chaperone HscB [bacterium]|nr:Fe-S protein assembly co-chaperone HscB [bacterium]
MTAQADYFELFSLPWRYEIDRSALEAAYERLTLAHHPDFVATAPEAERQEAERLSAAVNEGYRTLSRDAERAAYLLGLLAGGRELNTTALPPGFLQKMFGLQEEVEELGEVSDGGGDGRRAELRAEAEAELETIQAERARLFTQAGTEPGQAALEPLQAIQSNLNCERYLRRLLDRLDGQRTDDD